MNKTYIAIALIIVLGFAVYANSLHGRFVWDDDYLVKDNAYIKSPSGIINIFTENIGAGSGKKFRSYRPLQMLSYMLDYTFWKLDVRGYHLSNILLHILAALTIYWLINILYHDSLLSLLTSLFFVVHPIHTEAVAYISGRADPLALLFMLLCFIFYLKLLKSNHPGLYLLMLASYILALLSRENSLILPVLLLLYHYAFREKCRLKVFLPIFSVAFIYILFRVTVLKSIADINSSLWQRIPGFFAAITNYIRVILLPFNLHMEYGNNLFSWSHHQVLLGILILFSLLTYALKKRQSSPLIFFSIFWFWITLLPASNLYPVNAYMAEHWLYLPSLGFFLILARALTRLYKVKGFAIYALGLTVGLLVFYSYLTIRQNKYWSTPLAFYERTLKYNQDSPRILSNLGGIYYHLGNRQRALALYKKSIAINPNLAESYNNLANLYNDIGKRQDAITLYKQAIEIDAGYAPAYCNLGNVYSAIGKQADAITAYEKAIAINPNLAEPYYNLGVVYATMGKPERAITFYKQAITIDPNYTNAYNNLANLYNDIGKRQDAITLYKQAIKNNPNLAAAYHNLSVAYLGSKQYQLAIEYCDKAKALGFVNPALLEALKPYRKDDVEHKGN